MTKSKLVLINRDEMLWILKTNIVSISLKRAKHLDNDNKWVDVMDPKGGVEEFISFLEFDTISGDKIRSENLPKKDCLKLISEF